MHRKIIAITQARIGSSRLPGKVLKDINGKSLLSLHLERVLKSKRIDKLWIATTTEAGVEEIINVGKTLNVQSFQGSLNNVLDRFYQTALQEQPDYIVRITSDCPLLDASLMDDIIDCCIAGNYDYVSNTLNPTFPDGVDVEVFTMAALQKAWNEATIDSEKEHVTPYIWKNSSAVGGTIFKSFSFEQIPSYAKYRLTVDEASDLTLIQKLTSTLGFGKTWKKYIDYLETHPQLLQINSSFKRNEGYMKSIEKETVQLRTITNFAKSDEHRNAIHQLIPGGAHTYSKGDDQFPTLAPAAISHGKGAYVWDIDGNEFLDCSMGLTSVSLGHAYPEVIDAVKKELDKGVNFQRPAIIEREMAEKFLSLVPQHDMIKFGKNGSLVITAAVKLARAKTGRKMVAFPSDHPFYSYDDWFIGKTPCDAGVPKENTSLSVTFKGCDLKSLEALFQQYPNDIACVISEPERSQCYGGTCANTSANFLHKAIDLCHKHGALFIQDEMITGFKSHFPGTISKYNTQPDMATWGKGIANGFSFCALTGKKEVMEMGGIKNTGAEKVFLISTTHGGETTALAAGLATIDVFRKNNVVAHNHAIGDALIEKCNEVVNANALQEYVEILPCNWMLIFTFKDADKNVSSGYRTLAMQEMIKRGVLFQGAFVPCFSHTINDVNYFAAAFNETLKAYQQALNDGFEKHLIGEPVKPVFRKFL